MGKYSPVAIAPKYMESFQCIGSECEETCCKDWRITIDKQTFKKYRNVQAHELSEKFKTIVIKTEFPKSTRDHAQIKLDEKGYCPFLDNKNLCTIHGKLGADYLSETCQTYPRAFSHREGKLHLYASLSCPEAARKALLQQDAMEMVSLPLPFPNEDALPAVTRYNPNTANASLLVELSGYILETASHLIRAPENRSWEAMIILGLMARRISRHFVAQLDGDAKRQAIVDEMLNFIDPGYLGETKALVQEISIERSHQIKLLIGVLRVYFSKYPGLSSYRQTLADALAGIQCDESDLKSTEARYNEAEEKWFTPFDDAHPHLLKNYLLNDIGKNSFPLGRGSGLDKEFIQLAIRFSMIRMTLIGIAGLKKEQFSEADYIRVVYTFSRNIEHLPSFMDELSALLEQDGLNSIAMATILMR